ncbi:uncharacterized protein BDW47DRAFT_131181 [Aspergillus candidus]|uniref:Uncharacterized protein n=1 Tax=Aspergillus candidus TaxID=41067 RepID=A0A2I2FDZ6_ASPCN|nr:hypothetical protein BDW47DRAFT_131181 [Aspergillus candidus]PLB38850.1 hypothetical protein BDW47DRAFT_131181 [Aspergillus candidus]
MDDHTFEVPIMLSAENLTYKDISKLNPFYDDYRTLWNASPEAPASAASSNTSSRSSSLRSVRSRIESYSYSPELETPPLRIRAGARSTAPKAPGLVLQNGNQYKPTYDSHHRPTQSHVAVVDFNLDKPLPPIDETRLCEEDLLALDLVDSSVKQRFSSHKKLFGVDGWLGDLRDEPVQKLKFKTFRDLGKKIKDHVEEIAGDVRNYPKQFNFHHDTQRMTIVPKPSIPISLDPLTQAKLYSDLEVIVCVSANRFLVEQYNDDRLSKESIKKTINFWYSKNRPQVAEFQFDQSTQRRLIMLNICTLQFHGESTANPVLTHSNLHNWKAIVKEMSVRTFCSPDSVIRKHMHDIHKLLNMLGAPVATFLAFEDLQMETLLLMKQRLSEKNHAKHGGNTLV